MRMLEKSPAWGAIPGPLQEPPRGCGFCENGFPKCKESNRPRVVGRGRFTSLFHCAGGALSTRENQEFRTNVHVRAIRWRIAQLKQDREHHADWGTDA